MRVTMTVNGTAQEHDVEPRTLLVHYLREQCGLTGTHIGCDTTSCGACTVHLGGESVKSCTVLAVQADGADIGTIEGLAAPDGTLHPVQQAVVDAQGFQCAFCMSGFIMATVGYLKTHPSPTRTELADGISGNLCRCQDYNKILDAMMLGAENMRNGVPAAQKARS